MTKHWFIAHLVDKFTKNKSYGLDIGIGSNNWEEFKNCKMFGIDKKSYSCVDKILDLEDGKLPFQSNLFDVAISTNTLNFIKNHYQLLKEINRVMKNNAVLLCVVNNQNKATGGLTWTQNELDKNLKQTGFKSILFKNFRDYIWARYFNYTSVYAFAVVVKKQQMC